MANLIPFFCLAFILSALSYSRASLIDEIVPVPVVPVSKGGDRDPPPPTQTGQCTDPGTKIKTICDDGSSTHVLEVDSDGVTLKFTVALNSFGNMKAKLDTVDANCIKNLTLKFDADNCCCDCGCGDGIDISLNAEMAPPHTPHDRTPKVVHKA